ncbi:MAG TPA: thioesterase family protein [Thermoanaerobaculia bacterium]|nr:thioesterase family protein [Thermoanaerobaculia bacterium]
MQAVPQVESRIRVRYKETDQMGIAHHANYITWFEVGRTDLCRAMGVPYREIEARGLLLVVTEVSCRYRSPFRYDDEVIVTTRLGRVSSRSMTFLYALSGEGESTERASGASSHIWLDSRTRRPIRPPADVAILFSSGGR